MKTTLNVSVAALVYLAANPLVADEAAFARAHLAAEDGRLGDMQAAYQNILIDSPSNMRALNGLATAMAWQGDYTDAQQTFRRSLDLYHRNVDARIGLGYAYAWNHQYRQAHTQFNKALSIDPGNLAARKGIAYSFHWQGKQEFALGAFETAASMLPDDPEIIEAIGRVNLELGHERDAIAYFNRALTLDPARSSAIDAKRAAYLSAPALELTSILGSTSDAGAGLRNLEIAHWLSKGTRLAIRYDNSLGLDNPSLQSRGEDAPGYFASIRTKLNDQFSLSVEAGTRDLVDNRQQVITVQGTYFAPFGALQLGTQQGHGDNDITDSLLFAGINLPLGQNWRLEPMLYVSETGATSDSEWRSVLGFDYRANSVWQAGAFLGGGQIDAADPSFSGSTASAGVRGNYLLADRYTFHWSIRRDDTPAAALTIAEIGFTYRLITN